MLTRRIAGGLAAALLTSLLAEAAPNAPAGKPIPPDQFDALHKMFMPQPGEVRFLEIPWLLTIHDGRVKAAAEGKPLFIWSGAGGQPTAVC